MVDAIQEINKTETKSSKDATKMVSRKARGNDVLKAVLNAVLHHASPDTLEALVADTQEGLAGVKDSEKAIAFVSSIADAKVKAGAEMAPDSLEEAQQMMAAIRAKFGAKAG